MTKDNNTSNPKGTNAMLAAGWISVKESLPEKDLIIDVVINNEYGQYRVPNAAYRLKDMWHKSARFEIYEHTDGGMRWVDVTSQVTHWMLPPALPDCR